MKIGAHVSREILICLRHLYRSTAVAYLIKQKKYCSLHTCATCSELQSNLQFITQTIKLKTNNKNLIDILNIDYCCFYSETNLCMRFVLMTNCIHRSTCEIYMNIHSEVIKSFEFFLPFELCPLLKICQDLSISIFLPGRTKNK